MSAEQKFFKKTLYIFAAATLAISTAELIGRNEKSQLLVFDRNGIDGFDTAQIFIADPGNPYDIKVSRLTEDVYGDIAPIWSEDGQRILYVSYESGEPEVWEMKWDGSGKHELTSVDPELLYSDKVPMPNFSSDKRMTAASEADLGKPDMYYDFVSLSDGTKIKFKVGRAVGGSPKWQPKTDS